MPVNVSKIATLKGHTGSVYTLAEGISESTFFTGSSDHYAALWSLEKLEQENFAAKFPAIIYALCHIPEKGLLIAGTAAGSIHVLDLEKKQEIKSLVHHTGPVFDIKYSLESKCFYSASGDGNFAICSLESLSLIKIKKLCGEKVRSIDVHLPSSQIAVASGDCMIRVFDLNTLDEKHSFKAHDLSSNIVRYSPDGNFLFTGGRDAYLNVWDAKSYTLIKSIAAHNFAVYDIVFSPDGKLFATASRDKTFKIWDMNTLEVLVRVNKENYEGHSNSVNKLIWSKYKDYLISTGDDRMIMIWNIVHQAEH
ncbi:MAG: repeat protein [Bacteroidota bacterium]|jgi:WD40 repeat protein|nr:repeat protein [Bacteroidota bacterium]